MALARLVLVLLFGVCGTIAASPPDSDAPPAVLVLGDSLSAAYGMPVEAGWVALLAERLNDVGYDHRVVNASISGETSSGGRERLPALLARHRPEVVVVELGGNDGLRGLPPEQLHENLTAMVRQAQEHGARVLLVGMRMPPNYGPEYTRRFAAVYQEVADATGAALVPFFLQGIAGEETMMQPDRVHASAAAQPRLLANIWPALEPLLGTRAEQGFLRLPAAR